MTALRGNNAVGEKTLTFYPVTHELLFPAVRWLIPTYLPVPNQHEKLLCKPQDHSKIQVMVSKSEHRGAHTQSRALFRRCSISGLPDAWPFTRVLLTLSLTHSQQMVRAPRRPGRTPGEMSSLPSGSLPSNNCYFSRLGDGRGQCIWACIPALPILTGQ